MQPKPFFNAAHCPLCGQDNTCAQETQRVTGQRQPPCWCTQTAFSADLLAKVPADARNKSCICVACAKQAQATQ